MHDHFSLGYRYLNIILACVQNMTLGGVLFGKSTLNCIFFLVDLPVTTTFYTSLYIGWASISGTMLVSSQENGGAGLTGEYVHVSVFCYMDINSPFDTHIVSSIRR